MKQNRLRSKVVWAAIAAQVLTILLVTHIVTSETANIAEIIVASILEILVTVGVLNNPTDKEKF